MYLSNIENSDFWSAAKRQGRVMYALMLRNIRTKFFGNGFGYIVSVGWPLSHILILVIVFSVTGRTAPFGDSTALFVATGIVPFQAFSYMSRFMMLALVKSKQLLAFPEVKVLDMLFAAALVEIMTAFSVVIVFLIIAWFSHIDAIPRDIVQASCALGACILLGIGFGLVNGLICLAFYHWYSGYSLIMILFWLTSGVYFVPDALPAVVREPMAYLPVVQLVEWMRSAYYEGYGEMMLDRTYTIVFGLASIFVGLGLERLMRGYVLARR